MASGGIYMAVLPHDLIRKLHAEGRREGYGISGAVLRRCRIAEAVLAAVEPAEAEAQAFAGPQTAAGPRADMSYHVARPRKAS